MLFDEPNAAQFVNLFNLYLKRLNINFFDEGEEEETLEGETEDSLEKEEINKIQEENQTSQNNHNDIDSNDFHHSLGEVKDSSN